MKTARRNELHELFSADCSVVCYSRSRRLVVHAFDEPHFPFEEGVHRRNVRIRPSANELLECPLAAEEDFVAGHVDRRSVDWSVRLVPCFDLKLDDIFDEELDCLFGDILDFPRKPCREELRCRVPAGTRAEVRTMADLQAADRSHLGSFPSKCRDTLITQYYIYVNIPAAYRSTCHYDIS